MLTMICRPHKTKDSVTTAGVPGDARAGVDQENAVANGEGLEKFVRTKPLSFVNPYSALHVCYLLDRACLVKSILSTLV